VKTRCQQNRGKIPRARALCFANVNGRAPVTGNVISQESAIVIERLLLTLALAHVIAGVSLTILPFAPLVHFKLVAAIFGEGKASEEVMFLVSVFGPTVASWGVLFFALVRTFFRNPTSSSWWVLVLSIAVWASLDSALCGYYGLYSAVALNAAVAALFLGLLFSVRGLAYNRRIYPDARESSARR
jgi:hypothetical protein